MKRLLTCAFLMATSTSPALRAQPAGPTAPATATTPAGSTAPPVRGAVAPAGDAEVSGAPGKGLTVRRTDDTFAMTLRARIQMRETLTFTDSETRSELLVRTVRFFAHGHVLNPDVRYLVQLAFGRSEFEADSASPIFDAWLEYGALRDLNVRAGQYFVPFDRARTIRESSLQLVDRQQAIGELNLDRDVGVVVHSQDLFGLGGRLNYALGIFGGGGRNRTGGEDIGFLYMARLGVKPFGQFDDDVEGDLERLARPRLALGVAAAHNQNTARQRSTLGPTLELGTIDYDHAAADLVFKLRGFSLLSEIIYRKADRDFREGVVDGEPAREYTRSGWGYLVQAGMMLTDHLEIAGRYDRLRAFDDTDPELVRLARTQGHEAGGGLNLYLNGHALKVQADYNTRFGSDVECEPDETCPSRVHFARLQLDASF